MTQWLTFRTPLVDWKTQRKTEEGNPVRLEEQVLPASAHPLLFGKKLFPIGQLPIGGDLTMVSRLEASDEEFRIGVLVDEFGVPVMNELGAMLVLA